MVFSRHYDSVSSKLLSIVDIWLFVPCLSPLGDGERGGLRRPRLTLNYYTLHPGIAERSSCILIYSCAPKDVPLLSHWSWPTVQGKLYFFIINSCSLRQFERFPQRHWTRTFLYDCLTLDHGKTALGCPKIDFLSWSMDSNLRLDFDCPELHINDIYY